MNDYADGELELVETQRKAGKNDVGMVAWLMTIKTIECPTVSTFDNTEALHFRVLTSNLVNVGTAGSLDFQRYHPQGWKLRH